MQKKVKKMSEDKYIRIFYSVFEELGLSGDDAIVYSYIQGYSHFGQYFYGGAKELVEKINVSERTAFRVLKRLSEENLIFKTKEGFRTTTKMERICMQNKKAHDNYRKKYLREEV